MANVWVGGDLMKNGLHFDNFDNLLHQIQGSKRVPIPPMPPFIWCQLCSSLPSSERPPVFPVSSGAHLPARGLN